jgi:hypothetical protein
MTTAKFLRNLLRDQWGQGDLYQGVEKPRIVHEGEADRRAVHTGDTDVIFCIDGGTPEFTPQSIGYREEYIAIKLDAELLTSVGRERLLGPLDETYGGLEGETRRILQKFRKGVPNSASVTNPGYDVMRVDTFNDQIGETGAGLWKGTWSVTLITYAKQIQQDSIK